MGQMRFIVAPPDRLRTKAELAAVHVVGPGERVEPATVTRMGDLLIVDRPGSGSARLRCPWPVPGFGNPVVATCSLSEHTVDAEPHRLVVELARGLVGVAREQVAAARRANVELTAKVLETLGRAWGSFVRGACGEQGGTPEQAAAAAEQSIAAACAVADAVAAARADRRLALVKRQSSHPPASLAVRAGENPDPKVRLPSALFGPFRTAAIPAGWASIEPVRGKRDWRVLDAALDRCEAVGAVPAVGPLLDFTPGGLPDWLLEYRGSPGNLESLCADFVETAIARITGRVRTIEVCGAANIGGALGLDEPTRLGLVARTVQVARGVDEENRLFLRIARPFGDYLARGEHRLAPLQFADALSRAGVGLDGVTLELAVGFEEVGTPPRTLAGYERLLAGWSKLGVPLRISLAAPAVPPSSGVVPDDWRSGGSPTKQAEWIRHHLPLFFATDPVVEVEWALARDSAPGAKPERLNGGGLLSADGAQRPALELFAEFARQFAVDPDAGTHLDMPTMDDTEELGEPPTWSGQAYRS
ncbi:hypothetical protein CA12_37070 [Alienimonas californiensis]|uniref:Uncharacterized protein n=2 Tax=Alienimonas californiensis TaxID=2527989 RepID=A0A517PDY6_9PLAN|nr:hypothetical protein CA12_37070 [Alienimonas californiensis]